MSRPHFEKALLFRKANTKSQKLCPFVKMAEKYTGVPRHLKNIIMTLNTGTEVSDVGIQGQINPY